MCCCDDFKDFGCFSECDVELITGLNAVGTQVYTIQIDYIDTVIEKTISITSGPINFSLSGLNRNFLFYFKIIKTDGTYLELESGIICGKFRTQQNIILT